MAEFDRNPAPADVYGRARADVIDEGLRSYMLRIYNYMTTGLAITGLSAWLIANTPLYNLFFTPVEGGHAINLLGLIAIFTPLALVFFMGFRIQRMSIAAAHITFWVFSALIGVAIANILLNFTGESVARVFFITAGAFAALSLWGYTTKRSLHGWGSFLFIGLIGIIIAFIANWFIQSAMIMWVASVIGVLVFAGLTAWDTQRLKELYLSGMDEDGANRAAIMGALSLYLNFINMFILLMNLLGNRE
jgi:FtsH-binding integral membrane protein